jgi:hypothetical protein
VADASSRADWHGRSGALDPRIGRAAISSTTIGGQQPRKHGAPRSAVRVLPNRQRVTVGVTSMEFLPAARFARAIRKARPMPLLCPSCHHDTARAVAVSVTSEPGRVIITFACQSCHYTWLQNREPQTLQPPIRPDARSV